SYFPVQTVEGVFHDLNKILPFFLVLLLLHFSIFATYAFDFLPLSLSPPFLAFYHATILEVKVHPFAQYQLKVYLSLHVTPLKNRSVFEVIGNHILHPFHLNPHKRDAKYLLSYSGYFLERESLSPSFDWIA